MVERNIAIDVLKLSMAIMVVGLHAGFLGDITLLGLYLTENGIFRIAVPVFLIINGFYFFQVHAKGGQISWLKKVLVLYLVWMSFYSYFWLSVPELSMAELAKLTKIIVLGYLHLWYISGMLLAAVILLFLHRLKSNLLAGTIIITFSTGVFIQYSGNYHQFSGYFIDHFFNQHWAHRNAIFFSYPFFCIGYLIHKHSLHEKISLRSAGIIAVLGIFFLLFESYVNYYQAARDGGFDNYISLLVAAPFVFMLFMRINIRGHSKCIALYSSAIYFIHPLVLFFLGKLTKLEATSLTIFTILISTIAAYFIIKINDRTKLIL